MMSAALVLFADDALGRVLSDLVGARYFVQQDLNNAFGVLTVEFYVGENLYTHSVRLYPHYQLSKQAARDVSVEALQGVLAKLVQLERAYIVDGALGIPGEILDVRDALKARGHWPRAGRRL